MKTAYLLLFLNGAQPGVLLPGEGIVSAEDKTFDSEAACEHRAIVKAAGTHAVFFCQRVFQPNPPGEQ
jgi:hypothetical protein